MNEYKKIPPDWTKVGVVLVCMLVSGIMMIKNVDLDFPNVDPWFLFALTIIAMPLASKNYLLNSQEMVERVFFVPIRRVQWKNVGCIILRNSKSRKSNSNIDPIFLVIPKGCKGHDFKKEKELITLRRMKKVIMKVSIPRSKIDTYKSIFSDFVEIVIEQS